MTANTYFLGNRAWWAAVLFLAPVVAAVSGNVVVDIVVLSVLLLPAFIVFDTDRRWWSQEVRTLLQDKDRSRREVRLLTACAAAGLGLGLAAAYLLAY